MRALGIETNPLEEQMFLIAKPNFSVLYHEDIFLYFQIKNMIHISPL